MDHKARSDGKDNFHLFHKSDEDKPPPQVAGTIGGFRDGLGLAMQLADEYAFLSAGVLLDELGNIVELVATRGIGRPIGPLVGRVCAALDRAGSPAPIATRGRSAPLSSRPGGPEPVHAVVLLTVRPFDADVIREADLGLFRRARWAIGAAGADLLDWIETDGDLFRSYAYVTCPALAWPDDPPGERLDRAWSV